MCPQERKTHPTDPSPHQGRCFRLSALKESPSMMFECEHDYYALPCLKFWRGVGEHSLPTSSHSSEEQQKGRKLNGHHESSSARGAAGANALPGWESVFRSVEEWQSEAFVLWKVGRQLCVMMVYENVVEIVSSASKHDTRMVRVQYSVVFLPKVVFSNRGLWNGGSLLRHLSEKGSILKLGKR